MTVTAADYQDYRIDLANGHGGSVSFFVFNGQDLDAAREQIAAMQPIFARIPLQHMRAIGPIFLLKERPFGASGGGTSPSVDRLRARRDHIREQRAEAWGATWDALETATDAHTAINTDMVHFIPEQRWNRTGYKTTVIHECTHGIDSGCYLTRRCTETRIRAGVLSPDDFPARLPGQACGHGTELNRRAVNAYVSMVTGFRGARQTLRDQIVETFHRSSAFFDVTEAQWERFLAPGPAVEGETEI